MPAALSRSEGNIYSRILALSFPAQMLLKMVTSLFTMTKHSGRPKSQIRFPFALRMVGTTIAWGCANRLGKGTPERTKWKFHRPVATPTISFTPPLPLLNGGDGGDFGEYVILDEYDAMVWFPG
jgi:hypothetical protein